MNRYSHFLLTTALFISCAASSSAIADLVVDVKDGETLSVKKLEESVKVTIDGNLDESFWSTLPAYDEFVVTTPETLGKVPHATLVRIAYSEAGFYVGVDLKQSNDSLIQRLSGRDRRDITRDSISFTLDTSGEGRYGYWFSVSLGDSLQDGTVLPERKFTSDWDGAWYGASQETATGWSAEFFVPWGTVSMPTGGTGQDAVRSLGLYMSRQVGYLDERWGWPGLLSSQAKFLSVLQPIEVKGVIPKKQYAFFPFSAITRNRVDQETNYRVGTDFFWRPTSNLQISGTVNPDFGGVEADAVVVNLSAVEVFFPEKRLFFVEGQEVFVASPRADTRGSGVGNRGAPYTMVNTRRIGGQPRSLSLAADEDIPDRESDLPVDLLGALKVTGQSGRFRYGFFGAFEEDIDIRGTKADIPVKFTQTGSDYGVARLIYEDSKNGAYRALGVLTTAVLHESGDALVTGIDGHYLTSDGKIQLDSQVMTSSIDGEERGFGGFIDGVYTIKKGVQQRLGIEYFDKNIDINDLGFLQRNDSFRVRSSHIRVKSGLGWARENQFDVRGFIQKNSDDVFTGGGVFVSDRLTLNNLSSILVRAAFFPKAFDDLNSFGNGTYRTEKRRDVSIRFSSADTNKISFGSGIGWREEMLGGRQISVGGGITWRPNDLFSFRLRYSWADRDGWLIHQEDRNMTTFKAEQWTPSMNMDYFFSARQQLTATLQWVGIKATEDEFWEVPLTPGALVKVAKPAGSSDSFGRSQMTFQVRYRWEIAPLSDLFIVYIRGANKGLELGDNTFSDVFQAGWENPIADAFIVKLRYRFGS
ncbi:MAG: hypothetical protein ACJAVI_003265 [Candidatus Azotimanducaceae bacterium]